MLVNAGEVLSNVIFVTCVVTLLPPESVPVKEMVYIAPFTNVTGFDKVVVPLFNSVPLRL